MKMYNNLRITGKYVYAVVFNDAGQAWKPASSAFVTYTVTRSDFVVQLPEIGVTGKYGPTTIPGTGPGRHWEIYVREGGSASHDNDEGVGIGFDSIDANIVQVIGNTTNASNLASLYGTTNSTLGYAATINASINIIMSRIGDFTGTGVNTILGFFKAIFRSDATLPTDIAGTFTPTTDSLQAITDGSASVGLTNAALVRFCTYNTGETVPVAGSVAKLAQGAADPEVFFDATLGILADHPAGSLGERMLRIPNFPPAGAGGLPTVNASNRVVGVQDATNITSTGVAVVVGTGGAAGKVTVDSKTGYELSSTGNDNVALSVAALTIIAEGMSTVDDIFANVTTDIYYAGLSFIKDATSDEYTIQWYKNGTLIVSGITVPLIQVIKRSDGMDLIASTAATQIGSSGAYKYDATTTARLAAGDSAVVVLTATIAGTPRVWRKVIGKDLPV